MIHIKVCPICGTEFETRLSRAVYCGELCACKARSIKSAKYAKMVSHEPRACEDFPVGENVCEKTTPQPAEPTAPLTQGRLWSAAREKFK